MRTTITQQTTKDVNKIQLSTWLDHFYKWESQQPERVYLRQPIGDTWKDYTWQEVGQQARAMASALRSLNLPPKSHIGIFSKNCAHWIMSDLAIMMAGHVSVPLFPTLTAEQLKLVLDHSETKVLFVGKLDDWENPKQGISEAVQVISFPAYKGAAEINGEGIWQWDDLCQRHEAMQENYYPEPRDLATICYTSGTTGRPKGVMISYYAFAKVGDATIANADFQPGNDRFFSYLPLNHMAERIVVEGASFVSGGTIYFAESLDTFAKNLQEASPTHFLAVPRIWTKFQQGVLAKLPAKKLDTLLKLPIISGIIKKKIRKGLGLDKARFILTGAAPMPPDLFSWYHRLGVKIREGYGMSENTAACTIMRPENIRLGTVGQAQPGAEIRIDPKTGEILMRAEWLMDGYYKDPELTAETIKDGWLHTGDKGELSPDGFLKITGRVKEIFKTAKGEYVSPFSLESGFALNPYIEHICVTGAGLPQPIALVILNEEGKKADKAQVSESLAASCKEVNSQVFSYENLKHLVVLEKEEWTVDNGFITPTLKTKRNRIEEVYKKHYEQWYAQEDLIIWV